MYRDRPSRRIPLGYKLAMCAGMGMCLYLIVSSWPDNGVALLIQAFFHANHTNPVVQALCPLLHLVCQP